MWNWGIERLRTFSRSRKYWEMKPAMESMESECRGGTFHSSWVRSGAWVSLLHKSSSSRFLKLFFLSLVIYQPSGYFISFIKDFDIRIFLSFLIHAITSGNSMFTWTTQPISYFNDFLTFLSSMVYFTSSPPMLLTNHQKHFDSQNCQHFTLMRILICLLRTSDFHCSSIFLWAFISIYHSTLFQNIKFLINSIDSKTFHFTHFGTNTLTSFIHLFFQRLQLKIPNPEFHNPC